MKQKKYSSILVAALAFAMGACGAEGTEQDTGGVGRDSGVGQLETLDLDLEPGSTGVVVQALHEYLTRYGYFPNEGLARGYASWRPIVATAPMDQSVYDDRTTAAVKAFQANSGIEQTGIVDESTRERLRRPRCGVPDGISRGDASDKFAQSASKWVGTTLTWKLINTDDGVTLASARAAAASAFASWAAQTSLTFTQVTGAATIELQFMDLMNGPGDTLAYARSPGDGGDVFLDTAETWTAASMQSVMVHEIGHALGLEHSSLSAATMYPFNSGDITLDLDDKVGISSMYDAWEALPGLAKDISVGTDSLAWIIGTDSVGGGDFGIYKWNGTGWTGSTGGAVRIAAGGVPWVVNSAGQIYRRTSNSPTAGSWTLMPGQAKDIGVGQDGTAWIIGTNSVGGGDFGISKWDAATSSWVGASGGAVRIAVGPTGVPWVVNSVGQIYRRTSNSATAGSWTLMPGLGKDIGISDGNYAWLIGTASVGGGDFQVLVFDEQVAFDTAPARNTWLGVSGGALNVGVGPNGRPWIVNSTGQIYRSLK